MTDILKKVINTQSDLYNLCGFDMSKFIIENESHEYYAHCYCLGRKKIRFRIAKRTPNKSGFFVAMWKRNADNIIEPYDEFDQVDFFVVNIVFKNNIGQFVFPKSALVGKNIFSKNGIGGKRAMRIYSPWDEVNSLQASNTKAWQVKYFVDITSQNSAAVARIKFLYCI